MNKPKVILKGELICAAEKITQPPSPHTSTPLVENSKEEEPVGWET